MSLSKTIEFTLNGRSTQVDVPLTMNTLTMLREKLDYTGTKYGCGEGECGACTIHVDGKSVNACLMFAVDCAGRSLTTIEGIANPELSDLQNQMVQEGAIQCGFCTPGMIMQGTALLNKNKTLTTEEIKRGLEGNLCRCTGYKKIIDAVATALEKRQCLAQ